MLRTALGFAVILMLAGWSTPPASSALSPMVGSWHGVATLNGMSCTFDRVITPGTYSEIERCGTLATSQRGTYRIFPNSTVSFVVQDFTPRRRYVQDTGYAGHWELNATPPGGTFRYTFVNANTMVFRDVNLGGSLTYRRVQ
jgi:hypothetical protein